MHEPEATSVQPAIWVASFNDPHAMAAALREAEVEYLAIGPETYRRDIAVVEFGAFAVQSSRDGAHITRGAFRSDRFGLLFGHGDFEATANGWAAHDAGSVILGPGAEIRCLVPRPVSWVSYTLDAAWCETVLDGHGLPGAGHFSVAEDMIARVPALRTLALEIETLSWHDPARLAPHSVAASMQDSLLHAVGHSVFPTERGLRALRQRTQLVARAEAFLDAMTGRPVYTQDVIAALGTPARSLHTAFVSVYGMGVHQYLKLRRLNLVRARLRAGTDRASPIKGAALSHGFWHLGRFSRDYRALFGETPSETLAGVGRLPGA